jgi:hypothetical protein
MREHGVRQIRTVDTDFNQFPFLATIDPVRAPRFGLGFFAQRAKWRTALSWV